MTYLYEQLGDERFQRLCQAILVKAYPLVQSLPVGQPDGGRDAFIRHGGRVDTVFQVKYTREPSTKDSRETIEALIASEKQKVEKLKERGLQRYVLMTNVSGTSHQDAGSIDRVNKALVAAFDIPSFCYWRNDLDAALDSSLDLKWAFPEILRATDVISLLFIGTKGGDDPRRASALRAYVAHQYNYDAQLKFKQVDLQKGLIDLFVDVPVGLLKPIDERTRLNIKTTGSSLKVYRSLISSAESEFSDHRDAPPGAAAALLDETTLANLQRIVLEGAPGQGKSTVTQYICQVQRMRLLGYTDDLAVLPDDQRHGSVAIPFRIDLRDYATWLTGKTPFEQIEGQFLPRKGSASLETFIAAQVASSSGGTTFDTDDLISIIASSRVLIALDGFDEVAEIEIRKQVVREVGEAAARIASNALQANIIVTSRPIAFANSPGFSRNEWTHLKLRALDRNTIFAYADKWSDAHALEPVAKADLFSILRIKLELSHVRDLARNPMQLAILLSLMNSQGVSLPDKRTILYDRYLDTFLNREAEKSPVVRDHRDLIVAIHRYLAWLLQAEAEKDQQAGSIGEVRLHNEVRLYLSENGHGTELADLLFNGMIERVVVLVSRVQGTYEFEVQPLREYFAGRYLHDTVPYIQASSSRRGSIVDRFEALAENGYWLNVTRFYCGCYATGELPSLVDGVADLVECGRLGKTHYITSVATTLLADYIFNLQPRLVTKLSTFLFNRKQFLPLLAQVYRHTNGEVLQLPQGNGKAELVKAALNAYEHAVASDVVYVCFQILRYNSSEGVAKEAFTAASLKLDDRRFFMDAAFSGEITWLDASVLRGRLTSENTTGMRFLFNRQRTDVFEDDYVLWHAVTNLYLDGSLNSYGRHLREESHSVLPEATVRITGDVLKVIAGANILELDNNQNLWGLATRFNGLDDSLSDIVSLIKDHQYSFLPVKAETVEAALRCALTSSSDHDELLMASASFVEAVYKEFGGRFLILAAAFALTKYSKLHPSNSHNATVFGVIERVRSAIDNANDGGWWRQQFDMSEQDYGRREVIILFILCCSDKVFNKSLTFLQSSIDALSPVAYSELINVLEDADLPYHDIVVEVPGRRLSGAIKRCKSTRTLVFLSYLIPVQTREQLFEVLTIVGVEQERPIQEFMCTAAWRMLSNTDRNSERNIYIIRELYKQGIVPEAIDLFNEDTMPLTNAYKILADTDFLPLSCIGRASDTVIAAAGSQIPQVANTARQQEWFVSDI